MWGRTYHQLLRRHFENVSIPLSRWLGFPRGTHHARPGMAFDSDVDSVTLLVEGRWAVPTFHAAGIWCELYAASLLCRATS